MTSFRAILVALLLLPVPAEAWVYYTSTSSGETVRWESGGPCTLAFQYHPEGIDSIPGMKEFTIFEDAMALWNANPCTDVVLTLDGVDDGCDIGAALGSEQNCIVVTDSGWVAAHPQSIGAAMLTILSYKPATGLLGDVDIDINEDGFDFGLEGSEEPQELVDYRFAVAHELGHVYGLDHPDCDVEPPLDSIMCSDGEIYLDDEHLMEPGTDDFAGVCALYDRTLYACDDSPPEPEPEPGPEPEPDQISGEDIVVEPAIPEGGGGKKGTCAMGISPVPGVGILLCSLALLLSLRRRRTI